MTIATEAVALSHLAKSKKTLREMILKEANTGARFLRLDYLQCNKEWIPEIIKWLECEGLRIKVEKVMEKPTGFGVYNDEDEIERTYYQINW